MTTKYKIIFGFASMMIIIVAISMLGYRYLDKIRSGFNEADRFSLLDGQFSKALANFNAAVIQTNMFLITQDDAFIKAARNAMAKVDKDLDDSIAMMKEQENLKIAGEIRRNTRGYADGLDKTAAAIKHLAVQFQTKVLPGKDAMEQALVVMMHNAQQSDNAALLFLLNQTGIEYANLRYAMANFIHTRCAAIHLERVPGSGKTGGSGRIGRQGKSRRIPRRFRRCGFGYQCRPELLSPSRGKYSHPRDDAEQRALSHHLP